MAQSNPLIEKILRAGIQQRASDIHLVVGSPPVIRVHGDLFRLETAALSVEAVSGYVKALTPDTFQVQLQQTGSCNFSLELEDRAFRVNVCQERRGPSIVMRLISNEIRTPEQLGLAASVIRAVSSQSGLVLATGATGSGRSTTLASLLDMLARTSGLRIVTIEQPVEYRFEHHAHSLVTQREVPLHTRDFREAVVDALRQDPDVMMIGELRTYEDMREAITAAETGHLVLSTLHTNSAAESVDRLVGSFPSEQQNLIRMQLSTSLRAIVSQSILPTADKKGRVLVHEVLVNNPAIGNLIRKGETHRITSSIQTGAKEGMMMFDDHLLERLRSGVIDRATAFAYARDKPTFANRVRQLGEENDE